jgi:N6-L-threonylcarbamoyladenine synthase
MCHSAKVAISIAPMELCTDNAAMAAIAWEHLRHGKTAQLDADVLAGLIRVPAPHTRTKRKAKTDS